MKVHKYITKIYEGTMDFMHGQYQNQIRLYIPDKAVIGFRNIEQGIDFFSDSPESLAEGEKSIGVEEASERYIGFVELPDELISNVISLGRQMNESKKSLQTAVKSLNDLMKDSLI